MIDCPTDQDPTPLSRVMEFLDTPVIRAYSLDLDELYDLTFARLEGEDGVIEFEFPDVVVKVIILEFIEVIVPVHPN